MLDIQQRRDTARILSWQNLGKRITFFLPGMFRLNGHTGRYPAISITGPSCDLKCDHCGAKILADMFPAPSPQRLLDRCRALSRQGHLGVLISGGCRPDGTLPWHDFLPAIEAIKNETDLFVSIHCGLVDVQGALALKQAGVDQALIDVIGDDQTFQGVYHVTFGVERIAAAMEALEKARLPMVPHIVCGIDNGRIRGEYKAVEVASRYDISQLVIVALMPLSGTAMASAAAPQAEQVVDIIAEARIHLPHTPISLGCARQRGNSRLEELAIEAGINRMALPSEEALARARAYSLDIRYQPTCCSVPVHWPSDGWHENRSSS
jgi:uncharacterized radical SAM superfamily protein